MLTDSEIDWLKTHYSTLKPNNDRTELKGVISFTGTYNSDLNNFIVLSDGNENKIGGIVLQGSYKIAIKERKKDDPTGLKLPGLYLEEGQIVFSPERHFNVIDKSACFCGPIEEELYLEEGFQIQTFLQNLIIPFLYEQLYYDTYDKRWPWGEYGHGTTGVLESYFKTVDLRFIESSLYRLKRDGKLWPYVRRMLLSKEYVKGHINCFCESGDFIRRCHPEAWKGINKLRKDILELAIVI
ncbi:MAG TPA: hypothetical protein VIJ75_05095 [Hanamia sp.]